MDDSTVKRSELVSPGGFEQPRGTGARLGLRRWRNERALVVGFDNARLDAFVAPELDDFLNGLDSARAECVVFDLDRVEVADSSALAAIVRACRRVAASVDVRIVARSPQVTGLLRVTEVDRLIPVYATLEAALGGEARGRHAHRSARASAAGVR